MSDTYTKLFSSITESTVWGEPYATRIVWVTLLAMADSRGNCYGSVPGLARRANVTTDEARAALDSFRAPDSDSRTKDHDGRRIEDIDGGWKLLNHGKYSAVRSADERRDYKREWDRLHRGKSDTSDQNPTIPTGAAPLAPALALEKKGALTLPDWLPEANWKMWHDFRNSRRGWTHRARELSLLTLTKLRDAGGDPVAIIEQSIERGWTGLFPLKAPEQGRADPKPTGGLARRPVKEALAPAESRLSAQLRYLKQELDAGRLTPEEHQARAAEARSKLKDVA